MPAICPTTSEENSLNPNLLGPLIGPTKSSVVFVGPNASPLATPEALNQSWSVDFMHDARVCGRRFLTFNVVDDFNSEALSIEIDLNLLALCVVCVLDRIAAIRSCYAWIMVRNLSHLHRLNGQSNTQ